ncbi:hypothetical protein J5N97_024808 [Dioscorea zingiberensis]|uniref:Uncharacterized protein n=1 Tax=Dioscorea zingiberensis TaxID=325984 RepID=A0A9D5H8Y7_9LILI|nr:hypothetical protein J5N97_024808 [Dioscorea zingiberensis]
MKFLANRASNYRSLTPQSLWLLTGGRRARLRSTFAGEEGKKAASRRKLADGARLGRRERSTLGRRPGAGCCRSRRLGRAPADKLGTGSAAASRGQAGCS